jgi:NAD(P)-dependent dehydrogenase (short-subunit alcohol dehydrogenase family)
VIFKQVDVHNHKMVRDAVHETVLEFVGIDVLVASAGIAVKESTSIHLSIKFIFTNHLTSSLHFSSNIPAEGHDFNIFRRLIDINLTGTFIVAQAVRNVMIKSNSGGSMVFIASMSGHIVN